MSKYIDYERLCKAIDNMYKFADGAERRVLSDVIHLVCMQPFVDVQEVKHGKLVFYKPGCTGRNSTYKCSECRKLCSSCYNDIGRWNYCPHCGAKMDGGDGE